MMNEKGELDELRKEMHEEQGMEVAHVWMQGTNKWMIPGPLNGTMYDPEPGQRRESRGGEREKKEETGMTDLGGRLE